MNRDFRRLLNAQLQDMTVGDIMEMSTRFFCVSPGDSVIEAVEEMTREGIGRLLVMEDDTLVGIMSRSSIMDVVIKRLLA